MKIITAILPIFFAIYACKTTNQSSLRDGNIAKMDENGQIIRMVYGAENGMAVAYICSNQASSAFITLEGCKDKRLFPGTSPIPLEKYKENLIRVVGLDATEAELQNELQGIKEALAEAVKQQVEENVTATSTDDGGGVVGSFQALISDLEAKKQSLETEIQLRSKAQSLVDKVMASFDKTKRETTFASARFLSDHEYILAAWNETSDLPPLTLGIERQINSLGEGTYISHSGNTRCEMVVEKVDSNILSARMASRCSEFGYFECKERRCVYLRGAPAWKGASFTFDTDGKIFFNADNLKDSFKFYGAVNLQEGTAALRESTGDFHWGKRFYYESNHTCGLSFDPTRDRKGQLVRVRVTVQNNGQCNDMDLPPTVDLICSTSKFMCHASHMQVIFHYRDRISLHRYSRSSSPNLTTYGFHFSR